MNTHELLGLFSGLLAISAIIPYVISILQGKAKPHPISWVLWAIIAVTILINYWAVGARETIWLAVANFVVPFTISILSIKYWKGRFSRFDYTCLIISLISILIWLIFKNAVVAVTFSIAADVLAALPTIRKTYLDPSSEDLKTWLIYVVANSLSVIAIKEWSYGVALLPLWLLLLSSTISILVIHGHIRTNKRIV